MLLTLIALAAVSQRPTVGHGEKVLLRYKFETGDHIITRTKMNIQERFYGKEPTVHTSVAFDSQISQVVQNHFVDESAEVDEQYQEIEVVNGKVTPEPDLDTKIRKNCYDMLGRWAHVPGTIRVHPSDQLAETGYSIELPDEPVGVGAKWDTDFIPFSLGWSVARCIVTGIEHKNGHVLVDILYHVVTYKTKWTHEPDVHDVLVPITGFTELNMVFDATEGRFKSGEGVGKVVFNAKVDVHGVTHYNQGDANLTVKIAVFKRQ